MTTTMMDNLRYLFYDRQLKIFLFTSFIIFFINILLLFLATIIMTTRRRRTITGTTTTTTTRRRGTMTTIDSDVTMWDDDGENLWL